MSINMQKAIDYMVQLKNRGITYSMNGSRNGADGTADCSGAVMQALMNAGGSASYLRNTDSMHEYLLANGFKLVYENTASYSPKKGDVFIWGKKGQSGGAFGHTGIFYDNAENIIHCNYGYNGVTINNVDSIASANGWPYFYIYRLDAPVTGGGGSGSATNIGSLDSIVSSNGNLRVTGWHYADGISELIIVLDAKTNREVARKVAPSINRPDVKRVHNLPDAEKSGFDVTFPAGTIASGTTVKIIARTLRTGDQNKNYTDLSFSKTTTITSKAPSKPVAKFSKGQVVTLLPKATHWQTGQGVAPSAKNKQYKVIQIKSVNNSGSKFAYLLEGVMSWALEQDLK